jgi:hypothetical protein
MVMPGETQHEELGTSEGTTVNIVQGIPMEDVSPINYAARDATMYSSTGLVEAASAEPRPMPERTDAQVAFLTPYDQTFSTMASLMNSLIEKMDEVIVRVSNIENRLSLLGSKFPLTSENEVFAESHATVEDENADEVSREQAKEMILKLFEQKGELDYFEIISELDLDLKLVVEICAELEEEKRIEGIGR